MLSAVNTVDTMLTVLVLLSLVIVEVTTQAELQAAESNIDVPTVINEDSSLDEDKWSLVDHESQNITTVCFTKDQLGNGVYTTCPTGHSDCEKNQGLAVFTYERVCAKCLGSIKGWILYLFLATFPTTVFLLVVFGCGIKATSAPMNAVVCICQVGVYILDVLANDDPDNFRISRKPFTIVINLFSMWNLDFFRYHIPTFCISNHLTAPQILSMEYIVALYPLVCIIVVYVCIELHDRDNRLLKLLWKPFGKCLSMRCFQNYNPKMSIIEIFATFLILVYSKILFTSFNLMGSLTLVIQTTMENGTVLNTTTSRVMFYDPSIPYLSSKHLPFFILAVVILFIFNILPLLFLLLYPTRLFQKALGCCTRIRWHPLHAFADAFQGCYKNGTNGTIDCRYFAGLYLLIRALYRIPAFFMIASSVDYPIFFILISHTFSFLFGVFRPYRNDLYNNWDSLAFFLMPLAQFWAISFDFQILMVTTECILGLIMVIYMLTLATYKILSIFAPSCLERCKQRCLTIKFCAYISSAPETRQTTNTENGGVIAAADNTNEDDDLFEILDNRQDLQPPFQVTMSGDDGKETGASNEHRPITGCHYTYGSCR